MDLQSAVRTASILGYTTNEKDGEEVRGPPRGGRFGGGYDRPRYDDRGYGRRDEPYQRSRDRYDDRRDYRRDRDYYDRPPRRDDRYGRDRDDRRRDYGDKPSGRGESGGYGTEPLGAGGDNYGSRAAPPAAGYEDRGADDRYTRR